VPKGIWQQDVLNEGMNMRLDRKNLAVAALALVAVPASTVTFAASSGRQIEEVIVTAEKREASIQDTSMSITAFTTEFMDDFGIRNQEDLQNFIPATTIQPYDATIRGVGRNFRALGGDPGVATYMNGVYSEDLLTATAQTFWDVDRIEVLRGPQGTLYGRNAVGGAINMLWKAPQVDDVDWALKSIVGDMGQLESYGMLNIPLTETLATRFTFAVRNRDGVVEEVGDGQDLDGLGVKNYNGQIQWDPNDRASLNIRHNGMRVDRPFGGANGGGLVILNEEGVAERNFHALVPGYRAVSADQVNPLANDFIVPNMPIYTFTDPNTGALVQAQNNRAGIDFGGFDGNMNAAASLDGFGYTSEASKAAYNACVFGGDIKGSDLCAATNGLNREQFDANTTQLNFTYQLTDNIELKYIYGLNELIYRRTTDDDNTASRFIDRQFYVNHEASYQSHEFVAFVDFNEDVTLTSGIFFYDATIDQRGDYYSAVGERRFIDPAPAGLANAIFPNVQTTLHAARASCDGSTALGCNRNDSLQNPDLYNIQLSAWMGDPGTDPDLDVKWGPNTIGSDLLYHTKTEREAFAAYSQGVWQINDKFALTLGVRYASDKLVAEENLYRYTEILGDTVVPAVYGNLFTYNMLTGGFVTSAAAVSEANPFGVVFDEFGQPTPTRNAKSGGVPVALSIYRPFERKDTKTTFRANLDYDINDNVMMYGSVTTGHRAGGYNLVFFSNTPTYDPEKLIAYEIGYKTQFLDNSLQLNGSFYLYDYENIHTVATEVSEFWGTSTSTLAAPGAEIRGIEAELTWLVDDRWTVGGSFSFTPNEYTEDLVMLDPARFEAPPSLFGDLQSASNVNGNQLLQVPESKFNAWASYVMPLQSGANVTMSAAYSWIDDVYYSPFQNESEMADAFGRLDLRASWTSSDGRMMLTGFVNNVMDDIGVLQVLRHGEGEFFRQSAGTTLPRLFGLEFTVAMNPLR
jgi:outer membrane receptor protein involved in Fe transport